MVRGPREDAAPGNTSLASTDVKHANRCGCSLDLQLAPSPLSGRPPGRRRNWYAGPSASQPRTDWCTIAAHPEEPAGAARHLADSIFQARDPPRDFFPPRPRRRSLAGHCGHRATAALEGAMIEMFRAGTNRDLGTGPQRECPRLARPKLAASGDGAGHAYSCRFIRLHSAVCGTFGRIRRRCGSPLLVAAHARFVRPLPSGASLHARPRSQVAGEARARRRETRALIQADPGGGTRGIGRAGPFRVALTTCPSHCPPRARRR
jgi:hypothetical protein